MDSIKVAIAEDNDLLRNVLVQNFRMYDEIQIVIAAENGKILVDNLYKIDADIVLLDINMPVMDGYETIQQLQTFFPELKVIMYSTDTRSIVIDYFIGLGAYKFLSKSSNMDQIVESICEVFVNEMAINQVLN